MKLKAYKKDLDHSYALGVFPTLELLDFQADRVVQAVVSSDSGENEGVAKMRKICAEKGIELAVSDRTINRLSPKGNCHAIGVFEKYEANLRPHSDHIVLVDPNNMGNLGAIIRTSVGFGLNDLAIIRPGVDIFNPKVIRASMGAIFRIAFQYFDDFDHYAGAYDHEIYPFMLNGARPVSSMEVGHKQPFALVFGNEGSGLPDEFLDRGTSVFIPQTEGVDSLNLSTAVGIACYEFTRGRL